MCETSSRYIGDGAAGAGASRGESQRGCGAPDRENIERANGKEDKEREREDERPEGRSRTNDGIVTRLWMGASMKPMVCKTPRESACWRGQKGNGRSTFEIARAGSDEGGREKECVCVCGCVKQRGQGSSTKGENREAASVL